MAAAALPQEDDLDLLASADGHQEPSLGARGRFASLLPDPALDLSPLAIMQDANPVLVGEGLPRHPASLLGRAQQPG